jgi:glycosyltransferase involved in cell wall biosynthesis
VSVIVLAYNRPELLREALGSVRSQTFRDYEVIVIDDGSEPALTVTWPQVRLIRQIPNGGPAAAAARGLSEARGSLIAFLNDDDLWAPEFLADLVHALETHPAAGIAFSDHSVIGADGAEDVTQADIMSGLYGRTYLVAGEVDLGQVVIGANGIPAASFEIGRAHV